MQKEDKVVNINAEIEGEKAVDKENARIDKLKQMFEEQSAKFSLDRWIKDANEFVDQTRQQIEKGVIELSTISIGSILIDTFICGHMNKIMTMEGGKVLIGENKAIILLSMNEHFKALSHKVSSMYLAQMSLTVSKEHKEKHAKALDENTSFLVKEMLIIVSLMKSIAVGKTWYVER